MKVLALGLITMTLAAGCGSSKPASWSGGDTLQMKAERRAKLVGDWQTECQTTGNTSSNSLLKIEAEQYSATRREFNSKDCQGDVTTSQTNICSYDVELDPTMNGTMTFDCPESEANGVKSPGVKGTSKITITEEKEATTMATEVTDAATTTDGVETKVNAKDVPKTKATKLK